MIKMVARENWKEFFDDLSREMLDWKTTVQVLDNETGAQMLNTGLPFNGATFENKNGEEKIELMMTAGAGDHQTHTIFAPAAVVYESGNGEGNVLSIEDKKGSKTLITFTQPLLSVVTYSETAMVLTAE